MREVDNLNALNKRMFLGSMHLVEASKYFSDIDQAISRDLLEYSISILKAIKPGEEKVSEGELDDIINKIINIDIEDGITDNLKEINLETILNTK